MNYFVSFRRAVVAALASTVLALPAVTLAQEGYPNRAVRIVNNFPPGGPSDLLTRAVAEVLQGRFKQPFVVENRAGAAGNIGAAAVAKAQADGYTLLSTIDTTVTVNPHLYPSMPFKTAELRPLVILASSGLLVGVHPSTGLKSLNELLARAKTQGVNFSSAGSGSPGHLAIAVLTEATGAKFNHILYRGNTPAVTAVVAGEVDGGVLATPGMLPHVKAGKITALAVTSTQRSALAPDLPTVAELGLKQLELEVLYLFMVPAATPEPIVQMLQTAIVEAMQRPDIQTRLTNLDLHALNLAGAAAAQKLGQTSARYQRVVQGTGMKAE